MGEWPQHCGAASDHIQLAYFYSKTQKLTNDCLLLPCCSLGCCSQQTGQAFWKQAVQILSACYVTRTELLSWQRNSYTSNGATMSESAPVPVGSRAQPFKAEADLGHAVGAMNATCRLVQQKCHSSPHEKHVVMLFGKPLQAKVVKVEGNDLLVHKLSQTETPLESFTVCKQS